MKVTKRQVLVLIILASLCFVGWNWSKAGSTVWEYKIIKIRSETQDQIEVIFNQAGSQGWELVFYAPPQQTTPNSDRDGYYYFKRPK